MDRGALALTHTNRNDNTLPSLRSCLDLHTHIFSSNTDVRNHLFSKAKAPKLNISVLNYPSCKISSSVSHTFHPPLPLTHTHTVPPSPCSPATILSCSRSHRSLASAQSLEQGAQLGRQGLQYVWQCFSRPLYTAVKGWWEVGGWLALAPLFNRKYLKVFRRVTKINHQRARQTVGCKDRHAGTPRCCFYPSPSRRASLSEGLNKKNNRVFCQSKRQELGGRLK